LFKGTVCPGYPDTIKVSFKGFKGKAISIYTMKITIFLKKTFLKLGRKTIGKLPRYLLLTNSNL